MSTLRVAVIGAGPAGLTAARELLEHGVVPVVLEADPDRVGGISRTEVYRDYRFDIGGHRFFSKNREIEDLWTGVLGDDMLSVERMSRILYRRRFFDYPLRAGNAFRSLGLLETVRCLLSYLRAQLFPRRPEVSFEDWVSNRFGRRLFEIFFKTYTEKVWGMKCEEISADWAAQRIRGLNLLKAGLSSLGLGTGGDTVTTLIERFRYPRLGPGMFWERVAQDIQGRGATLHMGSRVDRVERTGPGSLTVGFQGREQALEVTVDRVISSMPMRHLLSALHPAPPHDVLQDARGLQYRDFLTVVLVVDQPDLFPDNWIYIHEPGVQVGRIQNYKNWSPEMVPDPGRTSLGLEYFCFEGDSLWTTPDEGLVSLATEELKRLELLGSGRVVDGTVVRMPRAYPVYDEGYQERVDRLRAFLQREFPEIQCVGRNGMHRYNNQDHAMLTGLLAARNLAGGHFDPWRVNADAEYLEEGPASGTGGRLVPLRRNT